MSNPDMASQERVVEGYVNIQVTLILDLFHSISEYWRLSGLGRVLIP